MSHTALKVTCPGCRQRTALAVRQFADAKARKPSAEWTECRACHFDSRKQAQQQEQSK